MISLYVVDFADLNTKYAIYHTVCDSCRTSEFTCKWMGKLYKI